jgi:hypothetical protein
MRVILRVGGDHDKTLNSRGAEKPHQRLRRQQDLALSRSAEPQANRYLLADRDASSVEDGRGAGEENMSAANHGCGHDRL